MSLSSQQLIDLNAALRADTDQTIIDAITSFDASVADNAIELSHAVFIADEYNKDSPTEIVWKSTTNVEDIYDVIIWKRMTQEGTPDGTQDWCNRGLVALQQLNALSILLRFQRVNTKRPNIRTGIKDALSNLPTRPDNTNDWKWTAGGAAAIDVMKRPARKIEAVFLTTSGTDATPADLVFEGRINHSEIAKALKLG